MVFAIKLQMTPFKPEHVIADHTRAACFIISDGVQPSGKQRGYILRRLMRRSFSAALKLDIDLANPDYFSELINSVIGVYQGVYDELEQNRQTILDLFISESDKYLKSIKVGQKQWLKVDSHATPEDLATKTWDLYQTFGVPIEVSEDILADKGLHISQPVLQALIREHQKLSQTTSGGQFKSGLGGDSAKTRRLHSVTHILHKALRDMFGPEVRQKGSAITEEKARFDFTVPRALTELELDTIRSQVQAVIDLALPMTKSEMTEAEARELGAIGLFGEKYGDRVTVYTMADQQGQVYNREFCGGPHITNSKEIGTFKILRQKSVGQGLRRIEYDVE